jgi:hypothetical protein
MSIKHEIQQIEYQTAAIKKVREEWEEEIRVEKIKESL